MNYLVVVDMQNDFITGSLGTPEAVGIVERVVRKITSFDGEAVFTRDTHRSDYLLTQEGKRLPVAHCILGSHGWELCKELKELAKGRRVIDKVGSFGSTELIRYLEPKLALDSESSITLVGLCTDICVITNALMLKGSFPEASISVDAACCAGVTEESHENALKSMKMCQIDIYNEKIKEGDYNE